MRPLARAAAVLTTAVTTAATFAVAPVAAQDVPAGLTAQITSPAEWGSVSGRQSFTVRVTADAEVSPQTATVTLTPYYGVSRPRTGTSPVPANCAPECDVTVTVDTVSWIDPGPAQYAQETSLPDAYVTVEATVTGTSASGAVVTGTASGPMLVDNARPTMRTGVENLAVGGGGPIPIDAFVNPSGDAQVDRLEATLLGPAGVLRHATFPGTPLDSHNQSRIQGSVPTTGLGTGQYMLRLVAFDTAGKPTDMSIRGVAYDTGPTITVNRLVPQAPTEANGWRGGVAELTVSVGPEGTPFQPEQVDIYLDGDTTPAGTVKYFPWDQYLLDPDGNRTAMSVKVPLHILSTADGWWDYSQPISAGSHTVKVVYTAGTSWTKRYREPSTATTTTTVKVTAPGVTAATTVKGPVVQNASGTLAFTLTSRTGTNTPATQIRSWKVTPFGAKTLASGTCTGTSCLSLTGSVPLKSLTGDYPSLIPSFHIVPVTLTYIDSAGVTRTTTVKVPVDPAVRTSVGAPTSGAAGATAYVTVEVQQLNNEMLPGVPVTLQARTAGSSTWRTIASTKTTSTGRVRVPVSLKYNTYWRSVVPARAGWNGAATSAQVYTKVTAKVTASGLPTTGVSGRYYPVKATLSPVTTGRRLSVQVRKSGTSTWKTVTRPATNKYGQVVASVKFARGTWQVRVVADAITASSSGASKILTIKVR